MKCLACNKMIRIKVNWQNIFREKKYFICDNCYIKYPVEINYQLVPMKKMVHVFSLFSRTYNIDPNAFTIELSGLFDFIRNKFDLNECAFFYFDTFNELMEKEKAFDYITEFDDIIAMVTYL